MKIYLDSLTVLTKLYLEAFEIFHKYSIPENTTEKRLHLNFKFLSYESQHFGFCSSMQQTFEFLYVRHCDL